MKQAAELRELLNRIDHRGYPAYKDTKGVYQFPGYALSIDHVQSDPFAPPSKVSVQVRGAQAAFPADLYREKHTRIALQDYLTRQFRRQAEGCSFKARGSGKSGLIAVSCCGQEVLERSACRIDARTGDLLLRMEIGFPARGRTIDAGELIRILFDFVPECVRRALFYKSLNANEVRRVAELAEDQQFIRAELERRGLVAFVADGAVLPRESGVSDRPMKGAVAFSSPASMAVEMKLPHRGTLRGMGIRRGVTLIVGGGYHGKSTLLKALEVGVYNHIAGDGREYVITDETAMKIRAEDGRSIQGVDISLFINDLPNGKDTKAFATEDASGSTSQAANVVEAMEAGARALLIDEDTSATNFMIRDALMQQVVAKKSEPITPFIDRVRALYAQYGLSTVLVVGSSGSYFEKADCVVQMERYEPREITAFAKETARRFGGTERSASVTEAEYAGDAGKHTAVGQEQRAATAEAERAGSVGRCAAVGQEQRAGVSEAAGGLGAGDAAPLPPLVFTRAPRANAALRADDRVKIKAMGRDGVSVNKETVDLRLVEQLVDTEQLSALGYMLVYLEKNVFDGRRTLRQAAELLWQQLDQKGLAVLAGGAYLPSGLAMPRRQELFACVNRYRGLRM